MRAGEDCFRDGVIIREARQEQHTGMGGTGQNVPRRVHPASVRETDVEQRKIRLQAKTQPLRLFHAGRLPHDLQTWCQVKYRAEPDAYDFVVVDDDQANCFGCPHGVPLFQWVFRR